MIRLAQQSDLPQVNAIRRQVHGLHVQGRPDIFQPEFDGALAAHIDEIFGGEQTEIVVADREGQICGFAVLEIIDKSETPYSLARRFLRVNEFGVDEACRRQGIGTRLFDFIKQYAAENGFDTIELDMWEFNEGARQFYEAVGIRTYRHYMEYKA